MKEHKVTLYLFLFPTPDILSTMLAASSILSVREDSSNSAGFRLTSIAITSLVPLAGPILVPILLDKLERAQRDSGLTREEAGEAEEARDGSAFAMIAA